MVGLIGGSGLADALLGEVAGREEHIDTPFGSPSAPVRIVEWNGLELAVLARHGVGHVLNPSQVPYRANIYAFKKLGVTHVIASGAVGSLREDIPPRDLVLVDQVIDKTHRRTPTFFDEGLAAHVEFAQPYCSRLRERLVSVADRVKTRVHERGTYVCMEGPAFSTIAESRLHRSWGADLIGMTTMPEAKLAREAEMCYALVALATDYDCWRPHEPGVEGLALLQEIIGHLKAATENAIALMRAAIQSIAEQPMPPCPCQQALELAIWSDRSEIDPAAVRRYGPLLSKYFGDRT
jgi:5'-methylthioadenosine phosphorylase